jgi:hypothetical protein
MLACRVLVFGCWCPAFVGPDLRTVYIDGALAGKFPSTHVRVDA